VLHIGNIANNAYTNAKIQRRHGIEADVACHDAYDAMGSPEWEDADFDGDPGDLLFPDWWAVDLHGYERPRWFAQGRVRTTQRYLLARRDGARVRGALLWRRLTFERWLRSRRTPLARTLAGARGRAGAARRALRPAPGAAADPGAADDAAPYAAALPLWAELCARYDVVQGYATDPAIPYLCGVRAYAAYEHGTLREIPFEDSPRGRLCAASYAAAPLVLVTNSDVLPSVERLGIDDGRVVLLPHAVDSGRLLAFAADHAHARPAPEDEVTFFSPARQDWVDGDPSWSKGNDRFLRAAGEVSARGGRFRLVLARWGRDLAATERLLEELGLAGRVEWVEPLRKRELWTRYLGSHAVVDQFTVPALGGVAFEAMALGRRVVTALDAAQTGRFFGAEPPVLAAREVPGIAAALEAVLADPLDGRGLGAAAREWFARHHSSERIVELQADGYRRALASVGARDYPAAP
jgi:glycosyltransferase involved in cell wall biosynthesis